MKQNVGGWDRRLRGVAGPILLGLGARLLARRGSKLGAAAAILAGGMLSGTAAARFCPMSKALGINTA
jgi:hypothetical protein